MDSLGRSWGEAVTVSDSTDYVQVGMVMTETGPIIVTLYIPEQSLSLFTSTDLIGTSWTGPVTIVGSAILFVLRVINGRPCMIYANTNDELFFVNSSDGLWGMGSLITNEYRSSDILLCDLNYVIAANGDHVPAVIYVSKTDNDRVKFVRADTSDGTVWNHTTILSLDSFTLGKLGGLCLTLVNDIPEVIATYPITPGNTEFADLRYFKSRDAMGETWNTPSVILSNLSVTHDAQSVVERYYLRTTPEGCPFIVYVNNNTDAANPKEIALIRSLDSTGDEWGPNNLVFQASSGSVGGFTLTIMNNGLPVVAWTDGIRILFTNLQSEYIVNWTASIIDSK